MKPSSRTTTPKRKRRSAGRPDLESAEDTRQLLLEAATNVFAQRGLDGTTVKDIAQEAGVNVAMISYYFQGKEGLFEACLKKFSDDKLEVSERILSPPDSPEDFRGRLQTWIAVVVDSQIENDRTMRICFREIESGHPAVSKIFQATILRLFECLVEFFRAAQKKGYMSKKLEPFMVASLLQGAILHMARTDKFRVNVFGSKMSVCNEEFRKQMVNQIVMLFFQGVK